MSAFVPQGIADIKRLQKSAIHRDEFESVFAKLVTGLTEEEILPITESSCDAVPRSMNVSVCEHVACW